MENKPDIVCVHVILFFIDMGYGVSVMRLLDPQNTTSLFNLTQPALSDITWYKEIVFIWVQKEDMLKQVIHVMEPL